MPPPPSVLSLLLLLLLLLPPPPPPLLLLLLPRGEQLRSTPARFPHAPTRKAHHTCWPWRTAHPAYSSSRCLQEKVPDGFRGWEGRITGVDRVRDDGLHVFVTFEVSSVLFWHHWGGARAARRRACVCDL